MAHAMEEPMVFRSACGDEFSTRAQLDLHTYDTHQNEKTAALQLQETQSADDEGREVF